MRAEIDPRNYGAYCDGSHDDTTALFAAYAALPAGGADLLVPGPMKLSQLLRWTRDNCRLKGNGRGYTRADGTYVPGASSLIWAGSAQWMVLWGAQSQHVLGGGIEDLDLLGQGVATDALHVTDAQHFEFRNVLIKDVQVEGLCFDNLTCPTSAGPSGFGRVEGVSIYVRGAGTPLAHGIVLKGDATKAGVFSNQIIGCDVATANGNGIIIESGDACTWQNVHCLATGTGCGVSYAARSPTEPVDNHLFLNSDVGSVWAINDPGSQNIYFLPYIMANGEPLPQGPYASHVKIVAQ